MKVKIHKNTVRRIISEELDRLELIYERVSGGSGKFNVRYDRGVRKHCLLRKKNQD